MSDVLPPYLFGHKETHVLILHNLVVQNRQIPTQGCGIMPVNLIPDL